MTPPAMRILVTGGSGFIGSALVRRLVLNEGATVCNLDKLTYAANPQSLAALAGHPHYRLVVGDIADPALVRRVFSEFRPSHVFHLAAESHVDRSIDGPGAFVHTNLVGSYVLLEAARAHFAALWPELQARFRFIHVSTDEVYGDLADQDRDAFTEQSRYLPSSPYSATKAGSDHLARAWYRSFGLPVIITNCSNNYGPRQSPEKLIPHMILCALAHRPLPIYGDGGQKRDWLYVDDHVDGLVRTAAKGTPGETYLFGGGETPTNLSLVEALCDTLDQVVPNRAPVDGFAGLIRFVRDRPGHDRLYRVDATKARDQLDWTPQMPLNVGLSAVVRWYLDNEPWWRSVAEGGDVLDRKGVPG